MNQERSHSIHCTASALSRVMLSSIKIETFSNYVYAYDLIPINLNCTRSVATFSSMAPFVIKHQYFECKTFSVIRSRKVALVLKVLSPTSVVKMLTSGIRVPSENF